MAMSFSLGLRCVPNMAPPKKPFRPILALPRSIEQPPKQSWRPQMNRRVQGWRICCEGKNDNTFPVEPDDNTFPVEPALGSLRTPREVAGEFYKLINGKEKTKILDLISDNCCYEDLVFYFPFEGKQIIGDFLHELMDSMGPHFEFVTENITGGKNGSNSASVNWHMEWKKKKIPFTTGFNYFEFKEVEQEVGKKHLLIVRIRGLEELPVKPGKLILKLLRTATTFFERYPSATEDLLSEHHNVQDMLTLVLHLMGDYLMGESAIGDIKDNPKF